MNGAADSAGPQSEQQCPATLGYRFPAEWEPQRATWLAWPHEASDWPGRLLCVEWAFAEIIGRLVRTQRVGLIASAALRPRAEQVLSDAGVPLEQLDWLQAETDRSWTRDTLPSWLLAPNSAPALGAVKWRFNAWARYPEHERDEAAGLRVAEQCASRLWLPRLGAERFVLEGGAIDTDGQGTLLTTEACLLGREFPRNPRAGREALEGVLRQYLCVDQVLWIPGGIAGDDTSGHVDDLARFVAPGRVVLAQEARESDENFAPLRAAREALEGACDARGRRIEVVPLPMPEPRGHEGQRLPASYANFLVANDQVLVPTFNDPKDAQALGVVSELFPDRQVVGIYCGDLVVGLGAIHCSTNHEPRVRA